MMQKIQKFNLTFLSLLCTGIVKMHSSCMSGSWAVKRRTAHAGRRDSLTKWRAVVQPPPHTFSLAATHCFPYVKKRIAVMYQHHTDLSPIEVAIDEMSKKVAEIKQLCSSSEVDMIRLQLKLQGSISVQVPALSHTHKNTHTGHT